MHKTTAGLPTKANNLRSKFVFFYQDPFRTSAQNQNLVCFDTWYKFPVDNKIISHFLLSA